jgi:hypothetical protein
MVGERFRTMLNEMLPPEVVNEAARRLGVLKRERKLDPLELVWALIFAGGTEDCGRLASVLRALVKDDGEKKIARSAFYQWFDAESDALMTELSARCCRFADAMPKHLPGILSGRRDWRAVDSTVVKLPKQLLETYPGTGDYASLKVHKTYSLGAENIVGYHITPGRVHDGPELSLDESWRGMGLVVDLGYASFRLLREARTHDVSIVLRLKEGWKVHLDESVGKETMRSWLTGTDIETVLREHQLRVDPSKTLDIDVSLGSGENAIPVRLVGVPTEDKGLLLFLTNLPRYTHSPEDVSTLYRLRWNIELDNKLNKSAFRLDHVAAQSPVSVRILVHAALIASIIANAFAHQDHVNRGYVGDQSPPLTESPIHPMLVAKAIATSAHTLAAMMANPETPLKSWANLASAIRHLSLDPNWRRKPSVLDKVKGRVAPPGRPRRSSAGSAQVAEGAK